MPIGFLIDINFYESQNLLNNTMHDQRRFSVKKKNVLRTLRLRHIFLFTDLVKQSVKSGTKIRK